MAKKVVATLKSGKGRNFTRCIRIMKSETTGTYIFRDEIVNNEHIKDFFSQFK